jgi:hypothetical protein
MRRERLEGDSYYTPKKLVYPLLNRIQLSGNVLECCAGREETPILDALDEYRDKAGYPVPFEIFSNDVVENICTPLNSCADASTSDGWRSIFYSMPNLGELIHWTVTNPPFKLTPKILPLALANSEIGVAFLLRLSYQEPCQNGDSARDEWLKAHADKLCLQMVVNPRPRHRADVNGSDNIMLAWFVWRKDFSWKALGVESPFAYATNWQQLDSWHQPEKANNCYV